MQPLRVVGRGLVRTVARPVVGGQRWFSETSVCLKDKRFGGREFRVKKVVRKEAEGAEGVDMEELIEELVEASRELDGEYEELTDAFEAEVKVLVSLSKGGAIGIEAMTIEGKKLSELASVSQGIEVTVNVYHQQNVLKIKNAIETSEGSYKTKMGLTSTTIMVTTPKMTREKREKLASTVKAKLHDHRHHLVKLMKQLELQEKAKINMLDAAQHREYINDLHAAEKDASHVAGEIADEATAKILMVSSAA